MSFLQAQYNKTTPMLRWLIFIITLCLCSTLVLILFQSKPNSLSFIKGFFVYHFISGNDSWKPMIAALEHIQNEPNEPAYEVLFGQGLKFQYPLTSLLLFDLPQRLTGMSYEAIGYWLDRISSICILLLSLISSKLLLNAVEQKGFEKIAVKTVNEKILIYILVFVLTCLFYPILRSFSLGQVQTILTVLTALALLYWQKDKPIVAGILIGFICLIKPQLALLFIWGLIRRQWKMVIAGGIVVAIFGLIAIGLYGFQNNLYYLQVLSFLSQRGESFYANQSVNGIMNRLLFNGNNLEWDGKFPDYLPLVYITTFISSIILMLTGLLWNYKNRKPGALELSIMVLCTTMASPIAWEHHYAILISIFLLMSPYVYISYKEKKWSLFAFAIGFLLVSQYYEFVKDFAETGLNILQSYLFFGACIILYFLFNVSKKVRANKLA